MKTTHTWLAAAICALAATLPTTAAADDDDAISVVYSGPVTANTRAAPTTTAFADWCAASGAPACLPTTQFPVFDTHTGKRKGMAYIWGAFPFNGGTGFYAGSICFSEFMVFALEGGEVHVHTAKNGTCGAFMDPALKPPLHPELGATAVIAGGGDGVIAGGTGRFKGWKGTFTDRVFVGFGAPNSGVGGIIYYDQLLFRISPKGD
jgi:hypothetical protein